MSTFENRRTKPFEKTWICFFRSSSIFFNKIECNHVRSTSSPVRSSHPEVFCKKAVLRNFAKFTGNTCARVSFLIKLQASRPATLLKKSLWYRCFPVNFVKFLRTPFFTEHLWWLLLPSASTCCKKEDKIFLKLHMAAYKLRVVQALNLSEKMGYWVAVSGCMEYPGRTSLWPSTF